MAGSSGRRSDSRRFRWELIRDAAVRRAPGRSRWCSGPSRHRLERAAAPAREADAITSGVHGKAKADPCPSFTSSQVATMVELFASELKMH